MAQQIKHLQKWECFEYFDNLYQVLNAIENDISQKSNFSHFIGISQKLRNQLSHICKKNRISIQTFHDPQRGNGVKIADTSFFNYQAAHHFLESILLERRQYVKPSYDPYLDKPAT